jgi:hypothetical protein
VIVPQEELDLVTGKRERRAWWLPVTRGPSGERQGCPFERGQCVPLQARPGVKGERITIIDVKLTTLGLMTDADATQQGYLGGLRGARAAWEAAYGTWSVDRECWALRFARGDHSAFYASHSEKYLRAKMGGGRSYTTDPARGVRGEGAVPAADLEAAARNAAKHRTEAAQLALKATLRTIEQSIRELAPHEASLDKQTKADLAWMRRRAARIRKELEELVAA